MTGYVSIERLGGVVTVRLDHPPFNVFDDEMRRHLTEAISVVEDEAGVRAVVITGGPDVFAAGADLKQLTAMGYEDVVGWNRALQKVFHRIAELPMPVIAAVNGVALGGGMELALAADFRVAADNARMGMPEVLLGIMPGSGGTQRLRTIVGPSRAKEMLMSGRKLEADELLSSGIVERVVPRAEVLEVALEFATKLARGPRFAISAIKEAVDHGADGSMAAGLALERSLIAGLFATNDKTIGMESFMTSGPGHADFGPSDRGDESTA